MRIGIPNQVQEGEKRVAVVPDTVSRVLRSGSGESNDAIEFVVEQNAGEGGSHSDQTYLDAGARVSADSSEIWGCDVVACVAPPNVEYIGMMLRGSVLMGLLRPGQDVEMLPALAEGGISGIAFETVPRITRAQKVDVLSAMSTVTGYRAVILAAEASPKLFPMLMTAAGTITPARVVILGAGVAGLQAIATARRLGAVVEAFDIRSVTKEQVESLGARFIEIERTSSESETEGGYAAELTPEEQDKQRQLLAERIQNADIVITTALVPGRRAPILIDAKTVEAMRPGSVVVDLAAEAGGNCELTQPGKTITTSGATVLGPLDMASQAAIHASQLYSRVVAAMLDEISADGVLSIDPKNDIMAGALVVHAGEILHEASREALGLAPLNTGGTTA